MSNFFFYHNVFKRFIMQVHVKSQYWPTGKVFVYKIQVNPIHTILKYGDYYDLWIGNGAVLKSSSQWQLKEF